MAAENDDYHARIVAGLPLLVALLVGLSDGAGKPGEWTTELKDDL